MTNKKQNNTLISDFKDLVTYSYKDYIKIKSYPYLSLDNQSKHKISKKFNTLFVNNKSFNLDSLSINDFVDIIVDNLDDVEVELYEEHPLEYLNSSALFLTDFDTNFSSKFYTTESIINLNLLENYTDEFNNKYVMKELSVYDEFWQQLPYYKRTDSIRVASKTERYAIVCLYEAVELKINFLLEYPVSSLNQLTLNKTERS